MQQDIEERKELHKKIVDIRTQYHLSISGFLKLVGLSPSERYFKDLCSKHFMTPPSKRRSPGIEFRAALSKFFEKECSIPNDESPLPSRVSDWCIDHSEFLRDNHISRIRAITDVEESSLGKLIVYRYDDYHLTDSFLVAAMSEDPTLSSYNLVVEEKVRCIML